MFSPEAVKRILDDLVKHYYRTAPKEAVGVILNDGSTIRLHNWSRAHDRYTVLTFKLFWLLGWKSWRHGAGIAAVYHSHRESTSPSQVDEVFMKFLAGRWPHVGHLIFTPDRDYQFWMVAE